MVCTVRYHIINTSANVDAITSERVMKMGASAESVGKYSNGYQTLCALA
jgi:hypothetical protein